MTIPSFLLKQKSLKQLMCPSIENLLKQIRLVFTLGFFYAIEIDEVDTVCTYRGRYKLFHVNKQRRSANNIQLFILLSGKIKIKTFLPHIFHQL